jgi:hypothetical protein
LVGTELSVVVGPRVIAPLYARRVSVLDRIKEMFGGGRSAAESGSVATFGAVAGGSTDESRDSSTDGTSSSSPNSGALDFGGGGGDSGGGGGGDSGGGS